MEAQCQSLKSRDSLLSRRILFQNLLEWPTTSSPKAVSQITMLCSALCLHIFIWCCRPSTYSSLALRTLSWCCHHLLVLSWPCTWPTLLGYNMGHLHVVPPSSATFTWCWALDSHVVLSTWFTHSRSVEPEVKFLMSQSRMFLIFNRIGCIQLPLWISKMVFEWKF